MPTLTTHTDPPSAAASTLHVALDLGNTSWCLACAPAVSAAPRVRVFPARILARLSTELASARQHFGLAPNGRVVLCYEAGRDGFWVQRACTAAGLTALVVDSSSIEVSRRARRAKTVGGSRQRRIGIVAVARRLMIELWRFVETGRVPEGAVLKA
jgi:hypothetical protein